MDSETVARLFRAVHTLKGAAYVVGCTRVGEIAHRMEDVLVAAREGSRPLTPPAIEALFAADGVLRLMLGLAPDPRANVTDVATGVRARLDALLTAASPDSAPPVDVPTVESARQIARPGDSVQSGDAARPADGGRPSEVPRPDPLATDQHLPDQIHQRVEALEVHADRLTRRPARLDARQRGPRRAEQRGERRRHRGHWLGRRHLGGARGLGSWDARGRR